MPPKNTGPKKHYTKQEIANIIQKHKNSLNGLEKYMGPDANEEDYDSLFKKIHAILKTLSTQEFINCSVNEFVTESNFHFSLHDAHKGSTYPISLQAAFYGNILSAYVVVAAQNPALFQFSSRLVEIKKILDETQHLDLSIDVCYAVTVMLQGHNSRLPTLEQDDLYNRHKNMFQNINSNILKERNHGVLTKEREERLKFVESTNYELMAKETIRMITQNKKELHSQLIKILEVGTSSGVLFSSEIHCEILLLMSQSPRPNLNCIYLCFKGEASNLSKTSNLSQASNLVTSHKFSKIENEVTGSNLGKSFISSKPSTFIPEEMQEKLNYLRRFMIREERMISHRADELVNQPKVFFIYIFISLKKIFESKKLLDSKDIKLIMEILQGVRAFYTIPIDEWVIILDILHLNRKHLNQSHYGILYHYANQIISHDDVTFGKFVNNTSYEILMSLLSSFKTPQLAEMKKIAESILKDNAPIPIDFIYNGLTQKDVGFSSDFIFLFEGIKDHISPEKISVIFSTLSKKINPKNPDKTQALLDFFTSNITYIKNDKQIFNHFLRAFYSKNASDLEDPINDQSEYKSYKTLSELQNSLMTVDLNIPRIHWKNAMHAFIRYMTSDPSDADYFPSEKIIHLEAVLNALKILNNLRDQAVMQGISTHEFYSDFINCLQLKTNPDRLDSINTIIDRCQTKIQEEQTRKTERLKRAQNTIQADTALLDKLIPGNIDLCIKKIRDYITSKEFDNASALIALTKQTYPHKREETLLFCFAACAKGYGQYSIALGTYQKIYENKLFSEKSSEVAMLMLIAYCHRQIGNPQHLEKAMAIYDKALSVELTEERRVHCMLEKATCFIQQARLHDAQKTIESITEPYKHATRKETLLAQIFYFKKDFDNAAPLYERLFKRENKPCFAVNLFQCYKFNKKKQEDILNQLEQMDFSYSKLENLVKLYGTMKKHQKALDILKQMQETWGKTEFIYIEIARCYKHLGQHEEAIALLTEYPYLKRNRKILHELANAYGMMDMQKQALDAYEYLLMEFTTSPIYYLDAIKYCLKIEDKESALRYWELCLEECAEYKNYFEQLKKTLRKKCPDTILSEPALYQKNMTPTIDTEQLFVYLSESELLENESLLPEELEQSSLNDPLLEHLEDMGTLNIEEPAPPQSNTQLFPVSCSTALKTLNIPPVIELLQDISNRSKELYIVGSTVHALINKTPLVDNQDVDIILVTNHPEELEKMFFLKSKNIANLYTYKNNKCQIDCTVVPDNGAEHTFLIASNYLSRDFKMNCLYADLNGNIYDPTNEGMSDLQNRRLKTVQLAKYSFEEDPVRMLRAIKYIALGYTPNQDIVEALHAWITPLTFNTGHIYAVTNKFIGTMDKPIIDAFVLRLNEYRLLSKMFNLYMSEDVSAESILEQLKKTTGFKSRNYAYQTSFGFFPTPTQRQIDLDIAVNNKLASLNI